MDPRSEDISELLRDRFAQDSEAQILPRLTRWLSDPLKPVDEAGHFRPSPVVVVLVVLGLFALGSFLYFGYWSQ